MLIGKAIISLFLCGAYAIAAPVPLPPRPSSPVADFANIVNQVDKAKIDSLARFLWIRAGFALVVATFQNIGEENIEEFSEKLYRHWGVGVHGKDEGALVVLVVDRRMVRIETGYGAEGYLPDAKAGRLIDDYGMSAFRNSRFSEGLTAISMAIAQVVSAEKRISLAPLLPNDMPRGGSIQQLSTLQVALIALLLFFLLATRTGRTILWFIFLSGMLRGGGGRSFGGFGGGFHGGFGGGMSGGGGASRRF